ncbi:MAG: penicillin-binding protein activator [Pseudomonadales bacterium]
MQKNTTRLLILFALVYQLLLTGCSTSPSQSTTRNVEQATEQRLQELYHLAKQSDGPASENYRVEAADLLSQQQRFEEAEVILEGISPQSLPTNVQATYVIVQAEISLSRFDGKTALENLNQHSELILQQGQRAQLRTSLLRASSFELMERHLDSARERIHLAPMLAADQNANNEAALWSALIKTPVEQLQQAATATASHRSDEQGWLSLALLEQLNKSNMDRQLSALQHWLQRWPSHPAALNLPQELSLLDLIITERPNNVVLMLPLQGKNAVAGKAIRDGFMAAYYDAKAAGDYTPDIRIIDTAASSDFRLLYDEVSLQGADFIIGPLKKAHVQTLQNSGSLITPTLALNYGAEETSTEQLYQFGLSAEDEARQIAEKAWLSGHKTSLILTPGSNWGQRISAAFSKKWQELGGTVLESAHFNAEKDYSSAIEELFDLDISKQRAKRLRNVLAKNLEFTARRRSDVDFIFVVATPKQARQIKPTLAFHFAGNVPVYATSHIYSGTPAPLLNRDLDGVIFAETPWLLSYKNSSVKQAIAANWPVDAGRLGRLYALGVDAYQLYPRIQLLSTNQENKLAGATGLLTLGDTGRVIRTLNWAHINKGHIEPLP